MSGLFALLVLSLASPAPPGSRELKILLEAEHFEQPEKGMIAFWARVVEVAEAQDVRVIEASNPFKIKRRQVYFLDTPDFGIRAKGYVLRVRRKYKKGRLKKKREFAIKFRSPDWKRSSQVSIDSPEIDTKIELEEDVGIKPDGSLKYLYAKRAKFKSKECVPERLGGFAEWFPVLKTLGLPSDSSLERVNGIEIDERKVSPGKLDFGEGIRAKADISLWYNKEGELLIAEFSFDHSIRDFDNPPEKATKHLFRFFKALYNGTKDWKATALTKTSFTYGAKGQ